MIISPVVCVQLLSAISGRFSKQISMAAVRPARVIGYDRVIPPLVLLMDHHHAGSRRLGDGGHHQADGGQPHSAVLLSFCRL
jgi:hypothetical protein